MYEQQFGLRRRPYPATPDRSFYYPATSHENALGKLQAAIGQDEGICLVNGAPGLGKTLLCHCLLERLGPEVASGFLTNSHFPGRLGLLQAILYDFSLPFEEGTEQVLRLRLTDFLLKNCAAGRRTLLLVDEAQHLTGDLLEELRLLGNLEAGHGKAFQFILVGQPHLSAILARPELAALNQRVVVRARLEPLSLEESVDYLLHQVRAVGGRPEGVWEEPALEILARGGRGVPRLLNQAAHQALTLAHQAEMNRVDAEAALEALALLGLEQAEEPAVLPAVEKIAPKPNGDNPMLGLMESEEFADSAKSDGDDPVCRLFDSQRPA